MPAATLTKKGQVVIPNKIRARYELTPGTRVEFADEGGTIRLHVRRRVKPSVPGAGYGMAKVKRVPKGSKPRRLSELDLAAMLVRRLRRE